MVTIKGKCKYKKYYIFISDNRTNMYVYVYVYVHIMNFVIKTSDRDNKLVLARSARVKCYTDGYGRTKKSVKVSFFSA